MSKKQNNNDEKPFVRGGKRMKKRQAFEYELNKFIGKDVIITDNFGNAFKGMCVALNYVHLNAIIISEKKKVIIKNVNTIERLRDYIEC